MKSRSHDLVVSTNYMVYDGVHLLAEVDSTGGLRRAYTHGPGIDNLLTMTVYTGATAKTYSYLTDHLGTVHALADETGSIIESYRFDAWGRVLGVYDSSGLPIANQQSQIGNRYLWQGREYSWSTGLYFFRARWYDPITGRWLSKDPAAIPGARFLLRAPNNDGNMGLYSFRPQWEQGFYSRWHSKDVGVVLDSVNQYVFCRNNPVNVVDPMGLISAWHYVLGILGTVAAVAGGSILLAATTPVWMTAGTVMLVVGSAVWIYEAANIWGTAEECVGDLGETINQSDQRGPEYQELLRNGQPRGPPQ